MDRVAVKDSKSILSIDRFVRRKRGKRSDHVFFLVVVSSRVQVFVCCARYLAEFHDRLLQCLSCFSSALKSETTARSGTTAWLKIPTQFLFERSPCTTFPPFGPSACRSAKIVTGDQFQLRNYPNAITSEAVAPCLRCVSPQRTMPPQAVEGAALELLDAQMSDPTSEDSDLKSMRARRANKAKGLAQANGRLEVCFLLCITNDCRNIHHALFDSRLK